MNTETVQYEMNGLLWRKADLHEGQPCVAGTGVRVRTLGRWYQLGASPGEIAADYPHLSLAQVHAAIAYFLQHRQELDTEDDLTVTA